MADDFDEDFATPTDDGRAPAAPGSTLASLRERREAVLAAQYLDLAVPDYDPPVYVRYKPITNAKLNAATKQVAASKDRDAEVIANAGVLAEACVGVFEVIDDTQVSIDPTDRDGTWLRFDKDLARLLGVPAGKAAEVVRALYPTDGHIISTVGKVGQWSGFAMDQLERDDAGN